MKRLRLLHFLPWAVAIGIGLSGLVAPAGAQTMPNPKEMSGSVLPVADVPVGTVTVRLIRGNFDKNIAGHPIEFLIDGKKRTISTDTNGRAEVSGLARGTRLKAAAVVDGERLESNDAVVESSGLRIILVATDPEVEKRAAEDRALASAPPVKGIVVLGPESRVIAQMANDRLDIYYVLQILNSARTPVDIGGPLIFNLPAEARGTTILEGSSPNAKANGARIIVTGPFPPGVTAAQAAFELPYSGPVARLRQQWPVQLQQLTVIAQQLGGLSIASPQITSKRDVTDQGQALILGTGPGIPAGQSLTLEISGLPHHATWPRNLALSLAGLIGAAGVWAALTANSRRQAA